MGKIAQGKQRRISSPFSSPPPYPHQATFSWLMWKHVFWNTWVSVARPNGNQSDTARIWPLKVLCYSFLKSSQEIEGLEQNDRACSVILSLCRSLSLTHNFVACFFPLSSLSVGWKLYLLFAKDIFVLQMAHLCPVWRSKALSYSFYMDRSSHEGPLNPPLLLTESKSSCCLPWREKYCGQ